MTSKVNKTIEIETKIVNKRKNGNALITVYDDGTRIIDYSDRLMLDEPLNIDIRISNKCAFGFNPKTKKSVCAFCHESARTDGKECDYTILKNKLSTLSPGIELAIGGNEITQGLFDFLIWAKGYGFICNLTVNQGHILRDWVKLEQILNGKLIYGLGISYRPFVKFNLPQKVMNYQHTVFHVIIGIDPINDVMGLRERGVKKILCLGEKNFGFNMGRVDLDTRNHKEWLWKVSLLFDVFDVVAFDNLAVQQLRLRRLFTSDGWARFNNEEHSLFIDSVNGILYRNSRSDAGISWENVTINQFFKKYVENS